MNKDSEKLEVEYLPAPGQHFFKYKGKKMWASQCEEKPQLVGWEQRPEKQRKLVLMCYGQDKELVKDLIEEGINHNIEEDKGRLCIYEVMWGYWQKMQTKKARNMDSVVLDEDIAETLKADIRKFQDSAKWYVEKGVPYRRGYLLYGPPGTGKTSFTQAIAGSLGLNLCYINLGNEMDDDEFNRILSEAPPRSILLLEDVDSMFLDRQMDGGKSKQKRRTKGGGERPRRQVTFSGFLNALDGLRSQEGQIVFMTTNHKEKLDPALLRPGRADIHAHLNYASEKQMIQLFKRFYPTETEERAREFSN